MARKTPPKTTKPMRLNFIVPVELQRAFKAATAARGESMTDVLLAFIEDYVSGKIPPRKPKQ